MSYSNYIRTEEHCKNISDAKKAFYSIPENLEKHRLAQFNREKKPILITILVCLGLLIIILPFLTHNYIYNTIVESSDLRAHSSYLSEFVNGDISYSSALYSAQIIYGVVFGTIDKIIPIAPDILYMLFMVLVMILAGFAIYYLFSHIEGLEMGWLILLISMFCCTSILALFQYGVIFNILNVYIILMFGIWFAIKWLTNNKIWYLVIAVLFLTIFCCLHPTGIYLPIATFVSLVGLMVYKMIQWNKIKVGRFMLLPSIILIIGVVIMYIAMKLYANKLYDLNLEFNMISIPLLMHNMTWFMAVLGIFAIVGIIIYRKRLEITSEIKYLLWILGSFAVALVIESCVVSSYYPIRISLDLAAIISMIIGVLVLLLIKAEKQLKSKIFTYGSYIVVGCGAFINILAWVR